MTEKNIKDIVKTLKDSHPKSGDDLDKVTGGEGKFEQKIAELHKLLADLKRELADCDLEIEAFVPTLENEHILLELTKKKSKLEDTIRRIEKRIELLK